MIFKSSWVQTQHNDAEFFGIIKDLRNIKPLMPEQVIVTDVDTDNIAITIQGMGNVALRVSQRQPNSLIQLVPVGKVPFPFSLSVHIQGGDESAICCVEIDADLNPLMSMMAKRPLQNLVDMMAERAKTI